VNEIQELRRQGNTISHISALTGTNRRTVRKYLASPGQPTYGPRSPRPTKLDAHRAYVDQRLQEGAWNAVVLLRELRARGYTGGYTLVKEYLSPKRRAAQQVAVRRFETPPGEQAQVDWVKLGEVRLPDRSQTVSGFVMTLGCSRAFFSDVATDQTVGSFLRLHEEAFHALGGVPKVLLYDWTKTVALGTDDRGEVRWHPVLLDFARHWGFTPRLCRPYRPQTKGKVENVVGYIRKDFLCGRNAVSVQDLSHQLHAWTSNVANQRVHGTTHRCVADAWEAEKAHLGHLQPPYAYVPETARRVARDAYVEYRTNRYSVPWRLAGQQVTLRPTDEHLSVWAGREPVAEHQLDARRFQVITDPDHHVGIPFARDATRRSRKNEVVIVPSAPDVIVRSLWAYEQVAQGGS
jgi:transposase